MRLAYRNPNNRLVYSALMNGVRLGDELDDYCIKCRRMTNHAIVSVVEQHAAKVRCKSCYNDHDFRNGIAPPTKRELKKQQELLDAVLAEKTHATIDPATADVENNVENSVKKTTASGAGI